MACKFKKVINTGGQNLMPLKNQQVAVSNAINCLLNNVTGHIYRKTEIQRDEVYMRNIVTSFQVDQVQIIYQDLPTLPTMMGQQMFTSKVPGQCLRPMSAEILCKFRKDARYSVKTTSKKTVQSHRSLIQQFRQKRNMTLKPSHLSERKSRITTRKTTNQKIFFAVKRTNDVEINTSFIEQLRVKKLSQEKRIKKKEQFLKSIQLESTAYTSAQTRFIQTVFRKKFIYGDNGQIIQINKKTANKHLKRISAISKSQIQIKPQSSAQLKKYEQQLKENIYVQFKGRDTHKRQQRNHSQQAKTQLKQCARQKLHNKQSLASKKKQNSAGLQLNQNQNQNQQLMSNKEQTKRRNKVKIKFFYNSSNTVYKLVDDHHCEQKVQASLVEMSKSN